MKKKYFLYAIIALSIILNVLFVSPYVIRRLQIDNTPYFTLDDSDSTVIKAVVETAMQYDGTKMSMSEFKGLPSDLFTLIQPDRHTDVVNNYYAAYNYAGLSQYALKYDDTRIFNLLKSKADNWISHEGKLNYELKLVDQAPIGIMYINLYRFTKEEKYKDVADYIYKFLLDKRTNGNLIPYNNPVNNLSDAVGMYVPFLMEYQSLTDDSLATKVAYDNISCFKQYGTDKDTHIPYHGYNMETGIKLGSCNWGRGIGWFLLATAYCPETNDSILYESISKMPYNQFPLSNTTFDSSTAILFEIYKKSVKKNTNVDLQFIKNHIRRNGHVTDCSGDTYNLNDYSHTFGDSELCNGLLLLLLSKEF